MLKKAKSYKEYPDYHFRILKDFRDGKSMVSVAMTRAEAFTNRHQLYRFFKALGVAALDGDPLADRLSKISKTLIIHVVTSPSTLLIKINPLSAALGDFSPSESPTQEEPSELDPAEIEEIIRGRKKVVDTGEDLC